MTYRIAAIPADALRADLPSFIGLLQDAVESGASVGFLPPLGEEDARRYWVGVADALDGGTRVLLAARAPGGEGGGDGRGSAGDLLGAVQLDLATSPNGRHRAEVMKLFVHRRARRQGVARALMLAIEDAARAAGRRLLVLDTRAGDAAEQLYLGLGYVRVGVIPRYARSAAGTLDATVYMYRELE